MHLIQQIVDFVLHIDKHLADIIRQYGGWTYGILFLIVFVETGLVIMPFSRATRCSSPPGALRRSARWMSGNWSPC